MSEVVARSAASNGGHEHSQELSEEQTHNLSSGSTTWENKVSLNQAHFSDPISSDDVWDESFDERDLFNVENNWIKKKIIPESITWEQLEHTEKDWVSFLNLDIPELRDSIKKYGPRRYLPYDAPNHLNPDLCKYCAVVLDNWAAAVSYMDWNYHDTTPYFETVSEIKFSASQGCSICLKITSIIDLHYSNVELSRIKIRHMKLRHSSKNDQCLLLSVESTYFNELVTLLLKVEPSDPIRCSNSSIPTSAAELSFGCLPSSTALVQEWIHQCRTQHEHCNHRTRETLPTRLIRIDGESLKLYITQADDEFPYVSLSHCWGTSTFLKLLSSNLTTFTHTIPLEGLSKSFSDAINITRALGYAYLWIDSLCIIQDDKEDWNREASRMASVYGGSDLNIAASAAANGDIGCIFPRNVTYTNPTCLKVSVKGQTLALNCIDYDLLTRNINDAPLSRRAWALQERLLAVRTIHFAESQLFWECSCIFACETLPDGNIYDGEELAPVPRRAFWNNWDKVVNHYTKTQLTYSSDNALAIAGIARQFASLNGDQYLVGLWQKSFIKDLCWAGPCLSDNPEPQRAMPGAGTVFPSWSWLSVVDTEVTMLGVNHGLTSSYIKIIDMQVTYETDHCFGNVREGFLTLDVRFMLRTSITSLDGEYGKYRGAISVQDEPSAFHTIGTNHMFFEEPDLACSTTFLMIPFAAFHEPRHGHTFAALLLTRLSDFVGHYRRIGMIRCSNRWGAHTVPCGARGCDVCPLLEYCASKHEPPSDLDEDEYIQHTIDDEGQSWFRIVIE